MRKSTLLVLAVLVLGLGALWRAKQRETARGGPALGEYPLCPDLLSERVSSIRVDNLQRSFQLEFERDQAGRWFLTDPVPYPAQSSLVRALLQGLETARGEPAPEVDPAQVGLDPPTVVIEVTQLVEGAKRALRIELGKPDVDSSLVYARVPGHPNAARAGGCDVFRTTRMLANTLERFPDDYRDRHVTTLRWEDVVGLRRRGEVYLAEEKRRVDLGFEALLGPDGWKSAVPVATLDPNAMVLLLRGASELQVESFVDDSPQDLTRYGLDAPSFTIELQLLSNSPEVLLFGHPAVEQERPIAGLPWFCMRRGYAHVWEVASRDVELLTRPADLFYDQLVVRMLRKDVARLELEGGGTRRVLTRGPRGWEVSEELPDANGGEGQGQTTPGGTDRIEEALALLERVQLPEHLPTETFEATTPPTSFHVQLENGLRMGGALGRETRDPKSGARGRQFLRDGDEVVALIGVEVLELCQRPLESFRSSKVHQLQESLVRAIDLRLLDRDTTYGFVNSGDNVWSPRGQSIAAPPDFLQSLDGLLNLGARRWLDEASEPWRLLEVRVLPVQGEPLAFTLGRTADGTALCRTASGQLAEVDPALLERLLRIF